MGDSPATHRRYVKWRHLLVIAAKDWKFLSKTRISTVLSDCSQIETINCGLHNTSDVTMRLDIICPLDSLDLSSASSNAPLVRARYPD